MRFFLRVSILTTLLWIPAYSSGNDVIVVSYDSYDDLNGLTDYPGGYWGKTSSNIFLSGGQNEAKWLEDRLFECKLVKFDSEQSRIYLIYLDNIDRISNIIYMDENFALSAESPDNLTEFRCLELRKMPKFKIYDNSGIILEYSPVVGGLIDQVSQDTLIGFLTGLSGETGVFVNGQIDTIFTRYSGTDDNSLAAEYLTEMLTNYGYSTEYHGFYGGSGRHVAYCNENIGWMVTEDSDALRTTNGGAGWVLMPANTGSSLWGVSNVGSDSVWIIGNNGTIRFSSDGGQSFSNQSYGGSYFLFGVNFINSAEGWIAGDNGLILRTTNGGQNWDSQSTPTSSRLYDVCFVDNEYGWAVGRNGATIHTTDGGANWLSQNANTGSRLYSIDFIDRDNGWLCGWDGVVRRTTDGGASWQTVYLGTATEKYHVDFVNVSFGCIVGFDGEIFTTTDAGDNWIERSSGTASNFYGVSFADTQNGLAAGSGIVARTTDGGITWVNQSANIEGAWRNVIATKTGTVYPDEQVVICAHMDNTSQQPENRAPGADDNGSGTTAVIEAARVFANASFEKTIKFCLWTGEEQGLLGSFAYASDASALGDNIVGVYNFDMIGYDGDNDGVIELHCGTMAPSIALGDLFQTVVSDYNISLSPVQLTYNSTDRSDHASFWDFNYPAILGIEDFTSDFNPYYHTTSDNMSHINASFFTEFAKAGIGVVATLATPDSAMTSVGESSALPGHFVLRANYPNPFNAQTTISFTLPAESDVELSVYDILGRKVARLHDGKLAAGKHNITWNAEDMASGLYFYRLSAEGREKMGRMVLLK